MNSENQYLHLRAACLAESTRAFLARGKSVVRCERCQLAGFACLCPWRKPVVSQCEFVLIMHRDELFKPTNTGRLIADLLPGTHVFCWHRTSPDPELLALLADESRQCFIVYPHTAADAGREITSIITANGKTPTFILLDGTWKQGGRMFHLSQWLKKIPCLALPDELLRHYAVRKSHQDNYVSTCEAAGLCLSLAGERDNSEHFFDYFTVFNQHYLATRACMAPEPGIVHQRLLTRGSA